MARRIVLLLLTGAMALALALPPLAGAGGVVRPPAEVAGEPSLFLIRTTRDVSAQVRAVAGATPVVDSSTLADDASRVTILESRQFVGSSTAQLVSAFRTAAGQTRWVILQAFEERAWEDSCRLPTNRPAVCPQVRAPTSRTPPERLLAAMRQAAGIRLPDGSTLASRIVFQVDPRVLGTIGAGLAPNFNIRQAGRRQFATYTVLLAAMAQSRGGFFEMFHGGGRGEGIRPFEVNEWLVAPGKLLKVFTRVGGNVEQLHFSFLLRAAGLPRGSMPAALRRDSMDAQFNLARQPGVNIRIFSNGVGVAGRPGASGPFARELREAFG